MKVWRKYWLFHLPTLLQSLIVFPIEVKVLALTCQSGESGPGSLEAFLTPLFVLCSQFTSLLFKYILKLPASQFLYFSIPGWSFLSLPSLLSYTFSTLIFLQYNLYTVRILLVCHIISLPCSELSTSQHTQNLNSLLWPTSPHINWPCLPLSPVVSLLSFLPTPPYHSCCSLHQP